VKECAPTRPITYERQRDLPTLLPLWPDELTDESAKARCRIVMKLHSALRAERCRGLAGHWSYDLIRHTNLLRAYRNELATAPDLARKAGQRTENLMQVKSGRRTDAKAPRRTRPPATTRAKANSHFVKQAALPSTG